MTASSFNASTPSAPTRPGTVAAIVIGLAVAAVALGLFLAGVTFLGLAIAFPIAVPIAEHYHVAISADDAALAQRLADLWWLFGALAVASVVGAVVVAVKAIQHLSPAPRD